MKVYNSNAIGRFLVVSVALFFIWLVAVVVPYYDPIEDPVQRYALIIFTVLGALIFISIQARDVFCPFIIDERGIANKLLGRWDILITWSEVERIYVGERHSGSDGRYIFVMWFAKELLHYEVINDDWLSNWFFTQKKMQFRIDYKEGMLDEILKYVDESKIENVERIKNCPNPHEMQPHETSIRDEKSE